MGEFELIRRYFCSPELQASRLDVCVGIGDDCALVTSSPDVEQAISVDTSIAGRHFPEDADPYYIASRSLNVSLSDLDAKFEQADKAIDLDELKDRLLYTFLGSMFLCPRFREIEIQLF